MISEYSRTGMLHLSSDEENQDVIRFGQKNDYAIISLADGVSSCKEAKCGAEIACQAITNLLLKNSMFFFELDEKQIAEFVLAHVLYELREKAREENKDINEYSSTLASVLVDKKRDRMLCFNLGDSLIMSIGNGKSRIFSMPSDTLGGCCVTTTQKAASMIDVKKVKINQNDSVIILSDGAWQSMFMGNRPKARVKELLNAGDTLGLKEYLDSHECPDDHSFVCLNTKLKYGRKSA